MLTVQEVMLTNPVAQIISRSGTRVNCERCREEIVNERFVLVEEKHYCISCAQGGYYQVEKEKMDTSQHEEKR